MTPILEGVPASHRITHVEQNVAADGRGFRVTCCCGWQSRWAASATHASALGEQHVQLQPA